MRIIRNVLLSLSLLSLCAASALAIPPQDGRGARPLIEKYFAKKGWTDQFKVMGIKPSVSGKSLQVAVQNLGGDKQLRYFNVRSHVFATPTGLISFGKARGIANQLLRRERMQPGTYAGVDFMGLTKNGNLAFRSRTDRNEAVIVSIKTGNAKRFENAAWLMKKLAVPMVQSNAAQQGQMMQQGLN